MTSEKLTNRRATPRQGNSYMAYSADPPDEDDPLLGFAPVPHVAPRRNSITADRQRRFIATLAATGIVKQAAKSIGASLEAVYRLRQRPGAEGFRAAWEGALDRGVMRLEDCALQRAIEGEERMVVSSGKLIGTERRYNTALTLFFLRERLPARYGTGIAPGHALYERIRAEVEAKLAAKQRANSDEVLASIDAKFESIRQRRWAAMSPKTRELWEQAQAAERADRARGPVLLDDSEEAD